MKLVTQTARASTIVGHGNNCGKLRYPRYFVIFRTDKLFESGQQRRKAVTSADGDDTDVLVSR